MGQSLIQARYDELEIIASRLGEMVERNVALDHHLRQPVEALIGGGWQGLGSDAFFDEMGSTLLPALDRLTNSFEKSQQTLRQVIKMLQEAEQEAASCLYDGNVDLAAEPKNNGPATNPTAASNYDFTFDREISHQNDRSLRPHVPNSDKSGVTLGPGYDMGQRQAAAIIRDLTAAGVDETIARQIADAHGKTGAEARLWTARWHQNHPALVLTREQEKALFYNVLVPEYSQRIRTHLQQKYNRDWDTLSDTQKAMLFDVQYNPGLPSFPKFTQAVLDEDWQTVSTQHKRYLMVNGKMVEAGRNKLFEQKWGYLWRGSS